jgi:hypothetical protein
MTMSPYRAIRHTATFIAMSLGVGISKVAQKIEDLVGKAEAGRAKKAGTKGKAATSKGGKGDAFEAQIREGKAKLEVLHEYLDIIWDG